MELEIEGKNQILRFGAGEPLTLRSQLDFWVWYFSVRPKRRIRNDLVSRSFIQWLGEQACGQMNVCSMSLQYLSNKE